MASRSLPADLRPSETLLICAACGPLSEAHAQHAGIRLSADAGLEEVQRLYSPAQPIPFPELRTWVAGNKAVQEALERIDAARSRGGTKRRPLSHAEIAGRARAALLLGKGKAFMQHYAEYTDERPYVWHPDPQHSLFWDRVLGPGWGGADAVPEGAARRELLLLSANAFAFFAPPAGAIRGTGLCGAPAGEEWLEVAAALRAGDAAALQGLCASGSQAAQAACKMLGGDFAAAQADFEHIFGRSADKRYELVQRHGLPLLIYALIGGIISGASPRYLNPWLEMARYAVEYCCSWTMEKEQAALMSLLDHLAQVDDLLNRRGTLLRPLHVHSALSQLPFAMAYRALPGYVRSQLNPGTLARAVEQLAADGLHLLARCAAAGLLGADGLSPTQQAALAALLGEGSIPSFQLPKPASERAYEALVELLQKKPRLGGELSRSYLSLPPTLVASRVANGVTITLADEEELSEYDDSPALRCMKKHASRGVLLLEGASPAEFTRLFTALQDQVDIAGSLALPADPLHEAQPQPVLLLAHQGGQRFFAALRLRLMPGTPLLMTPGCGLGVPVCEVEGQPLALRRDLPAEWALVEKTALALKEAGIEAADGLIHGIIPLSGFGTLAQLLAACRHLALECCWEKGHELKLHQPQGGLNLHRSGATGEWLELGGGLPVDEGRVLELSALLEAFAAREGDTLSLGGGEYVQLNPALERQLALLELVCQQKQGRQGIAASAIPLLDALEAGSTPALAADSAAPSLPLPKGLQATLRPYQAEGYAWLAQRAQQGLGALLADDMGLGKTMQVLALLLHAAEQPGAGPALVVAPVSLLGNWADEAARFAPSLKVLLHDSRKPDALKSAGAGTIVLASYGQLVTRQKDFAAQNWETLVLDEAQAIKNPDSQRAKAVCALQARARLCLTGTPVENSLLDLWSQMRFLNPGLFGTRAAFLRRFKKASAAQLALLRQVLAPLVLRRSKAEVLTQLPPLTETVEWVDFSKEERALYESLRRSAVRKLGQGSASANVGMLAELMRLRRACCHGKLALAEFKGSSTKLVAMAERVEELRAAGRRVLIFSQFTDVLDLAEDALSAQGITCLRLDGSTPAALRNKRVKAFQEGQADAFLISLKAGGAGLNLTAADYVMLLDPWWNPAVEAQAAGRSHRMGQQQPVTLCRFMVRGTVEERILEMHAEKKELAESVLSGKSEALSLDNLRALLA